LFLSDDNSGDIKAKEIRAKRIRDRADHMGAANVKA
jgi:hypothetical protein